MNQSMANQDDQKLIRRTLDGHSDAFGQLVSKYQNRLYNGLVHILRNEPDAEDVVQETFVLAYTKLSSFQGNSAFFTWLYRIGYNAAINLIRKRKKNVSLTGLSGPDETGQLDFDGHGPAPDQRLEQHETACQVMQAMDRLSAEHRAILVLREMDELDYEAISEILELPIGTVRSRLHRAREQLRHLLESATHSPTQKRTNPKHV